MRFKSPELDADQDTVAEEQEEFQPVTVAHLNHPGYPRMKGMEWNTVAMCVALDDNDRRKIAEGADLYVTLLTFGSPQQGIILFVGKEDVAACYNVKSR